MAKTRLVLAVLAFASLVQVLLAEVPPCSAAEVLSIKCDTKCGTMGLCASEDNWVPLETCAYGRVCDDAAGDAQCTPAPAPVCRHNPDPVPTDTVVCMGIGNFSSYENCHDYYACTTLGVNASPVSCPTGYVFNSCSGTCLPGACIPQAGPCQDGEIGVDPKNNRNHYYCSGSTRYWFACDEGQAYAVAGRMCVQTPLYKGCLSCFGRTGDDYDDDDGDDESCRYLNCKDIGEIEVQTCSDGSSCGYGVCAS